MKYIIGIFIGISLMIADWYSLGKGFIDIINKTIYFMPSSIIYSFIVVILVNIICYMIEMHYEKGA